MVSKVLSACLACLCSASVALAQGAAPPQSTTAPPAATAPRSGTAAPQGAPAPQGTPVPQATAPLGAPPSAAPAPTLLQMLNAQQAHFEEVDANHWKLTGAVVIEPQPGVKLYADGVDIFLDTHKLVASGNVVFSNAEGRLSAERTEFDLDTGFGTFYDASGIMSLGVRAKPAQFAGQEPDVYFYGEKIEKVGARQYRITRGGFSTCVQPTPRWEVTSDSVTLNLDDYALAKNTVLRVKGVPLLYLPVIYYPISSTQRQTGFLLPTYGTSTVRGQAISNAFFWAIDRSQDATFFHDWFTKTGQGEGAEYRYVSAGDSSGNMRVYRFDQKNATFVTNGATTTLPAAVSYELIGNMTQTVTPHIHARARVDYFSSVVTQQLYNQNLYQATNSNRVIDAGVTAGFGPLATSMQYLRNEVFTSATDTFVYGGAPRFTTSLAPQRLFGAPLYGSVNAEYGYLPYRRTSNGAATIDESLSRIDVTPSIRVPLSRLTYLSVNTSASYRATYYSHSFDPTDGTTFIPESYLRRYGSVRTEVVGPVLTRIWDLPESGFAERLKHVIEPAFTLDTISPIGDYKRTPSLTDVSDVVVGDSTRFTYGVTNRLFYRAPTVNGVRGTTREFVTVGIQQTYYTNPTSSRFDTSYIATSGAPNGSDLSPVALTVRVSPSAAIDLNSRVEYDTSEGRGIQTFTLGSGLAFGGGQGANLTYSHQHLSTATAASDYVSASGHVQSLGGRLTGMYSLSWDISRSYIVNQMIQASHMAQCCGWQVQFQKFNYGISSGLPLPSDKRLNFSFVLAGLGTFSNFFGAFGGLR